MCIAPQFNTPFNSMRRRNILRLYGITSLIFYNSVAVLFGTVATADVVYSFPLVPNI
jgi:hypothetical protein